jgi:hypothetical protein
LIDTETLQRAVELYRAHGNSERAAAKASGLARSTFQGHLKAAAGRGMLLDHPAAMPGFRISRVNEGPNGKSVEQKPDRGEAFALPAGHVIKGVSALVDEDGREVVKWIKTKEGVLDPLAVGQALMDMFADYQPAALPAPEPRTVRSDLCTLLPCNDWHINMSAWGKQVGVNWDLKIAETTIGSAAEETIDRSPPSAECVILGGGDLLHTNGRRDETANGTPQDADSRYQKAMDVITRLMVRTVDAALRRHQHITLRILKGNHDEDSSVAIAYFLAAWYRNEPRVTVDLDPSDYFWFRFGLVMLGATHGHQSSNHIAKMPGIMAHRRAEDWGATKFRYVHGFHLHHSAKIATEGNGVVCEIHQAPIPQDAWHFGSGFLSGRSLQAITYHAQYGEIGRVRTAILDADTQEAH